MPDYKKMYFRLFNKITDTISDLKEIQQITEETYISEDAPEIIILPKKEDTNKPK